MNYYILGVIFGIITALGIAAIVWMVHRKLRPNSGKYDERQIAGRGKAYQAGFFTLLIAGAALNVWEYCAGGLPGIPFLWHMGVIFLGIAVYALTAIHYDAYVGIYDKPSRFIRMGILFIVAMGLSGISNLCSGREEGFVIACLNLGVAVMWILIVSALLIHRRMAEAEEEE